MPRQSTVTEVRLNNIIAHLTPIVTLLTELNDAFSPPFVPVISNTIPSLINAVQNVKRNKKECAELTEKVPRVLYAIINLHIKSETAGSLPPSLLNHVGKFMETLHKIYVFVEAQQDGNKIAQLFRNNEMSNLLKECHAGLDQAMKVFGVSTGAAMFNDIGDMKKGANYMHEELLAVIQTLSDASTISDKSLVYLGANDLRNR
ncbi:hypothetical protein C8F04DRAFT_1063946 [Mycena alexandri]|uniref:Uncharacterized protein n=1 Tax=Mycena alexandri TaxID=1745969 RepID=A0AAD6THR8_9AGAR|nr:hypothetical protein C8F04DRAFT_1063946 [Mycena alexandri]